MMAIKVENMMQHWNKSVQTTAFKPPYKWKNGMHYLKGYIEIDVSNKQKPTIQDNIFQWYFISAKETLNMPLN